jgi:hypothetical protein
VTIYHQPKDGGLRAAAEQARGEMRYLFAGEPIGRLVILTLQDALERIEALERRIALLEKMLVGE